MREPATVVSFGGGLNSTALLICMEARGWTPRAILFADTGGEHPNTYRHVEHVDHWLKKVEFPPIIRLSNAGREGFPHTSLENECHNNKTLPSLAFGFKGCSVKWKRQPMDRYLMSQPWVWRAAAPITRLIGIDAGESHRSQSIVDQSDNRHWIYRRPLVEWNYDRDDCERIVESAGLAVPPRSACFYCPANKKHEVLALAQNDPELFGRAVAMERQAREAGSLKQVKGLGRNWSWEALVKADAAQLKLFPEAPEIACDCMDEDAA